MSVDLPAFGKPDQSDVREQLQLEAKVLLFARFARLHLARRAIGRGGELRVAEAAAAAPAPRAPAGPPRPDRRAGDSGSAGSSVFS